ncbi:protoporphyrinogen/coproporphyrinogen oxidase [Micromonospora echinospora]|uniref:protoporphyrinogen/coproporphyrinogen oxidase n=1 Tax=Micromonospora echinospora TaxID=1877 RepID=UPI003A8515D7
MTTEANRIGAVGRSPAGPNTAIVVGGGWSGMATAWYLHRRGVRVTLLDEQPGLGGRSASAVLGDRNVTLGGKNIGTRYTEFRSFVRDLAAGPFEHFGINSSRIENGRIRTVDGQSRLAGIAGFVRRTPVRDMYRFWRMTRWVRDGDRNRFVGAPRFRELSRRHGDPTIDGYFGHYLQRSLIRPMTVRMNGAEPDELHLADFAANLGMLLDRFEQLTEGFEPLFARFATTVPVELGTRVEGLLGEGARTTGVLVRRSTGVTESRHADLVVLALPATASGALLRDRHPEIADELAQVRYFPARVVIAEYDQPVFDVAARALFFGPESVVSNAGAYGRQDRHLVRYTFSGRPARPELASRDADELRELAERQLAPHFPGIRRARLRHQVTAGWEQAFCAYSQRHPDRLARVDRLLASTEGLAVTGDYRLGTSIEACFRSARQQVTAALGRSLRT